jgi:hypothetical protein
MGEQYNATDSVVLFTNAASIYPSVQMSNLMEHHFLNPVSYYRFTVGYT